MRFSLKVPLKINNSRTSCFALVIASRLRDGGLRDKKQQLRDSILLSVRTLFHWSSCNLYIVALER